MYKRQHCGFCTATCPTYQVLGDELDSPRGRIYLIKQVLEGAEPTQSTQQHLDRCLTCRNCETTCPSGVEYGHLVDIGRQIVEERAVSYTHLDVYKRQEALNLKFGKNPPQKSRQRTGGFFCAVSLRNTPGCIPVAGNPGACLLYTSRCV